MKELIGQSTVASSHVTSSHDADLIANSHGSAVSLTIFCHFSRSHDKAPNLTVFGKNLSEMN